MIVLNALFPIFGLLILGSLLKSLKLTTDSYLKVSDKLVYYIFFPIMLFWKVGGAPHGEGDQLLFVGVTLLAMVTMPSPINRMAREKLVVFVKFRLKSIFASCLATMADLGVRITGFLEYSVLLCPDIVAGAEQKHGGLRLSGWGSPFCPAWTPR